MRRIAQLLTLLLLSTLALTAQADAISRYARFTGNYNYVTTGGSLRTESNSGNYCTVGSSSSQALSGIPAGATVVAAYLYWGGSGATIDSNVTINASSVTASRTFTTVSGGNSFFGGFANVTTLISGNGTYSFAGLSVTTADPYCSAANVLAGWALVVIYESSSERLRAINIFDGLDSFYGSALSLTPDGFRIPTSNIDGKMTAITWEGDPNNSGSLNGFTESLSFNSTTLDDNVVPANSSPTVQQYDGSISNLGTAISSTSYGVDVDTYDVSTLLSAGQTSAATYYSAGGDRVFLAAQVISVTSEPQVDLSITKSHSGNFSIGSNASYTLHVANASGVQQVDYLTTVSDTLPAGLTYVSATGSGWNCSAAGQVVTCTHAAPLASGSAFADIALTVAVGNAAYPSISNTATVNTAGSNDYINSNNSATDVATVLGSNLSTSTKTVSDVNGGEANIGDTLRYTITLVNSSSVSATGVSLSDSLPGNTSNLSVVSYPSGASNTSTSALLSISNITVPANSSVTVVFDVVVATGTSPGATIDNTATITNPAGAGATPNSTQVVVSPSQVPGSGTKQLYLWNNGARAQALYRTPPSGTHNSVTVAGNNASISWVSTPTLQKATTLQAGNYNVYLLLARTGDSGMGAINRSVTVSLSNSVTGSLGAASQTFTSMSTTTTLYSFTLNISSSVTMPVGSTLTLSINNSSNNTSTRSISVVPYSGSNYSRVELNSASVINVDSVQTYNASYAGGTVTSSFTRGSTAYLRAVVSDPFGSFDISGATITLRNPSGTDVVTAATMTEVNDSGAATKTFQYTYAIPANAVAGIWTARVTAREGTENTITDLGVGTFTVTIPMPTLQVSKVSTVIWDPVNLFTNPKRIPGSIVGYTITVSNSGPGAVDASTLALADVIPANTQLCVSNVGQCTVLQFTDGSPTSGLSYVSGNTSYSNAAGGVAPYSYVPSADSKGVDGNVTGLYVAPTGALSAASASGNPGFSISFRVLVQ